MRDFEKSAYRRYPRNRLYFARINSILESSGCCRANPRSRKIHTVCNATHERKIVRVKLAGPQQRWCEHRNKFASRIRVFLLLRRIISLALECRWNTISQVVSVYPSLIYFSIEDDLNSHRIHVGWFAFPLVYNYTTTLCAQVIQSNQIYKSVHITAHMADCEMSHSLRLWCFAQVHRCTLQWINQNLKKNRFFKYLASLQFYEACHQALALFPKLVRKMYFPVERL